MTTILAGANHTMWPGLTASDDGLNIGTSSASRREHVRTSYAYHSETNTFTRQITEISEGWVGMAIRPPTQDWSGIVNDYCLEFIDTNGDVLFGIWPETDGNVYVNAPFLPELILVGEADAGVVEVAINFKIDETEGFLSVFSDIVSVGNFTGNTLGAAASGVMGVRLSKCSTSAFNGGWTRFSEILISDQPTINFKVVDTELSVGSLSQWDGTPSNITPVGYASAADSLSTEDADQLVTFSRPDIPSLDADEFIASVHFETSQLAETGATASEADLLIYDGSEHGAERIQPGTNFSEFRVQWDQDPRTNEPWTEAGVNEIEVGVASRSA